MSRHDGLARFRKPKSKSPKAAKPFRAAILRGLGVVAPPLLTVVIFLIVWQTVNEYVLKPVTGAVRELLVYELADVRHDLPITDPVNKTHTDENGYVWKLVDGNEFIPVNVQKTVWDNRGSTIAAAFGQRVLPPLRRHHVSAACSSSPSSCSSSCWRCTCSASCCRPAYPGRAFGRRSST